MSADKAKRTLLAIDIPRDELALRIGIACMGIRPPSGTKPADALAQMDLMTPPGVLPMGQGFRDAADAAVLYFHERVKSAKQPH